jgi:GTP:adenosylcobinamide-phosphate guanylyltransferase
MTIVLTCAGPPGRRRFPGGLDEAEELPEALVQIAGKPLVQWAVESLGSWPQPVEYIFIGLDWHEDKYNLTGALSRFMCNRFRLVTIPKRGHGQLATAMVASALFSNRAPVLVSSCNVFVVSDLSEHVERIKHDCRAVVVTSAADSAADFLEPWQRELQRSASGDASTRGPAGIYYFRDGRELADAGAAAVVAAAYASRPCVMTDAVRIYEQRGWAVEWRGAVESWRLGDPGSVRAFERRISMTGANIIRGADTGALPRGEGCGQ